jgi:hypothetical protein
VGETRHLDLDVDAVEERPGDAGEVASDLGGGAGAGMDQVPEVPAGTPVHVTGGVLKRAVPRFEEAGWNESELGYNHPGVCFRAWGGAFWKIASLGSTTGPLTVRFGEQR